MPTQYEREFSFTDWQSTNPSDPLPASHLDAELNRLKQVTDSVIDSLALIQRSDGRLGNLTVGRDQLQASLTTGINPPTVWTTATTYSEDDFVFHNSVYLHCVVPHTSGTFATDLAAGKWTELVDFSSLTNASETQVGVVELADDAEAIAKSATNRALTPGNLAALSASDSFEGMIELADNTEADAASVTNRAVTPGNLAALTATNLTALKASNAQAAAKSAATVFVSPANLAVLPFTNRNIVRANGGFEVWQRGAGGSASMAVAASTTAYTADRWYLTTGANQASVVDQIAAIADGSQFAARIRRNAGQTGTGAMKFGFPLDSDEVFACRNGVLALSFTVKAGANWSPTSGTLNYTVAFGTGSVAKRGAGFTGETTPISGNVNLTAGGAAQRVTVVAAAAAAANITQGEIQFTWSPTGTAGAADDFTIDDVQLEVVPSTASVASVFERTKFEECQLMCQRHFQKSFSYGVAPAQNAGDGGYTFIAGKAGATAQITGFIRAPQMRAAGTCTLYNPVAANAQVRDVTASADCSASSMSPTGEGRVIIQCTGNASTAVGNQLMVAFTVDAGI